MQAFGFLDSFLQSPWFFAYFIVLMILVVMIMPLISGWKSLAKSFPDRKDLQNPEAEFSFQSLRLNFGSYSKTIKVSFFKDGLRLNTYFPFSLSHKPIFIPYGSFGTVEKSRLLVMSYRIEAGGISILFFGSSGEMLFQRTRGRL